MLTMVYTTLSYTVVYNLFFIVVYVYFCLLVGMCYVVFFGHVSSSDGYVTPLGVRAEIQAASLSCVQKKKRPKNTNIMAEQFRVYICAFDQSCKLFWMNGSNPSVPYNYDIYPRRCVGSNSEEEH